MEVEEEEDEEEEEEEECSCVLGLYCVLYIVRGVRVCFIGVLDLNSVVEGDIKDVVGGNWRMRKQIVRLIRSNCFNFALRFIICFIKIYATLSQIRMRCL